MPLREYHDRGTVDRSTRPRHASCMHAAAARGFVCGSAANQPPPVTHRHSSIVFRYVSFFFRYKNSARPAQAMRLPGMSEGSPAGPVPPSQPEPFHRSVIQGCHLITHSLGHPLTSFLLVTRLHRRRRHRSWVPSEGDHKLRRSALILEYSATVAKWCRGGYLRNTCIVFCCFVTLLQHPPCTFCVAPPVGI
jgi:hypothetical protein